MNKILIDIKKINKKKIILALGVLLVIIIGYGVIFRGDNDRDNDSVEVKRGDVIRQVFEAGTVKKGEEIRLSFGVPGTLERIFFKEGDNIKDGQRLAVLDNASLLVELEQAKGALRATEIEFQKLSVGGSDMDLQAAQTIVANTESSLSSAIKRMEKAEEMDKERMNNAYRGALPSLSEAVLAADAAYETAKDVSNIHFSGFYTADSRTALNARDRIEWALNEMLNNQKAVVDFNDREKIDIALSTADTRLKLILSNLDLIRKILEEEPYRNVSEREINLLTIEMSKINSFSSSITSLIGSINTVKLTGETEIISAKAAVTSAKGALQQAEDQLLRIESPVRREDIELGRIRVAQAESKVRLIEKRVEDSTIVAPFDGTVLRVNTEPNEFVQVGSPVISVIPDHPYQTELQIYEGDIAGIAIGDSVGIEIVAFPNRTFKGQIIFIDHGSEIIDGVVTYRVLTSIDDYPEEIMFGMTVDVTIVPEKRVNVLYIPDSAVRLGTVLLIENGRTSEVSVETGLRGFDRNIEIVSGLEEGDRVVISR